MKTSSKFFSLLSFVCVAQTAFALPTTFHKDNGTWIEPAEFQCELKDHNVALWNDGSGFVYFGQEKLKPSSFLKLTNGQQDCGMGKCYYKFTNGSYSYELMVNHRQFNSPAAPMYTGHVTVKKGNKVILSGACRNPETAIVMCTTKNRTVYVTQDNSTGDLGYQSYDHTNRTAQPSLSLMSGNFYSEPGQNSYGFANGSHVYEVRTNTLGEHPGASVVVYKNGSQISMEQCSTYTVTSEGGNGPSPL
jgi:hypothetical protein